MEVPGCTVTLRRYSNSSLRLHGVPFSLVCCIFGNNSFLLLSIFYWYFIHLRYDTAAPKAPLLSNMPQGTTLEGFYSLESYSCLRLLSHQSRIQRIYPHSFCCRVLSREVTVKRSEGQKVFRLIAVKSRRI